MSGSDQVHLHQDSTNYGILEWWIREQGENLENMKNKEKMENINQMSQTLYSRLKTQDWTTSSEMKSPDLAPWTIWSK